MVLTLRFYVFLRISKHGRLLRFTTLTDWVSYNRDRECLCWVRTESLHKTHTFPIYSVKQWNIIPFNFSHRLLSIRQI